jgi:two-component system, OmpR family, phosphate regulon sensor histidine kinase PhoR
MPIPSSSPWPGVLKRLVIWVGLFSLLGWLLGALWIGLLLGIGSLLSWHYYNLLLLERWLRTERRSAPPTSSGVWGDVFNHIYRMQKRNRDRRRRLAAVLRRFRESAMAMPDGVVVLSRQGQLSWWNEQSGAVFGLRRPQDEGQRIINLVRHPQFVDYFQRSDFSKPLELLGTVDESSALEIRMVPYGTDSLLMLVRDVSERRRLQRMRRDFVANISHELRTPLTVIHGCLETMGEGRDEIPASWHRSIDLMQQQTSRMERMVNELVVLTRLQATAMAGSDQIVHVPHLLGAIRDEATVVSGAQEHRIVLEMDTELQLLGADSELRSAFSNLVLNAVHYTGAKGQIRIRWFDDHEGAHLQVIDTGQGVAAQDIPRLTERFFRTEEGRAKRGAGTGLGLAITKHVLQRHQARLRIESKVGEGSVFTCDFPPVRVVKGVS